MRVPAIDSPRLVRTTVGWVVVSLAIEMSLTQKQKYPITKRVELRNGFFCQRLLRFPRDLPCRLQELLIRKDGQVLADPPPPDDSLLIHEEKGPFCAQTLKIWIILPFCGSVHNAIRLGDFQGPVAE